MDSSMLKVGGQYFRCVCGANVFHKGVKPGLWICNGCGAEYTDENYDHRKSNADRIRAMNDHDLAVFFRARYVRFFRAGLDDRVKLAPTASRGGNLMEIEKLKDMLRNAAGGPVGIQMCQEAADALEQLQAENDRLKRERDAAVKDISDLIDEVEEIRRGYGIDDSDADKALADMCGNYCENEGDGCYIEGEKYHCENFKWRGPQKED